MPSSQGGRHLPVWRRGELSRGLCSPREGHDRRQVPKNLLLSLSRSSLLPGPCSKELQKEGFGLVSLLPLQRILNVFGLRSLQEGTSLPKTGALLFWVVRGIPGNQRWSPTDH